MSNQPTDFWEVELSEGRKVSLGKFAGEKFEWALMFTNPANEQKTISLCVTDEAMQGIVALYKWHTEVNTPSPRSVVFEVEDTTKGEEHF